MFSLEIEPPYFCSENKLETLYLRIELERYSSLPNQGQALHLDRGLFEIFRTLILAKISKNDTNTICKSLKKNNFSKI